MNSRRILVLTTVLALHSAAAHAAISLIATGSLSGNTSDLSGLSGNLENGASASLFGGIGSGLTWAGGNTFLALPDRGPNAVAWNSQIDDTTSYIPRFHTLTLDLTASGGSLPFSVTAKLQSSTLLYSTTALNYAPANAANNNIAGAPSSNSAGKYYFSGRSDNFSTGLSTNGDNARLDTEGIRLSADGKTVFISDEYGPYVYQFDRATGARIKTFELPANLASANLSAQGAVEISGNSIGRVANKGMEGLAISPDGKTLFGFMQSPLEQDSVGSPGNGQINRIVSIDIATGATKEIAYNNAINGKTFNSSELLALNDHEVLVLERDGKGLGDGSKAAVKSIYKVDLAGTADITELSGEGNIIGSAPEKSLFLDIKAVLNANGISNDMIPAKLEGMAFGQDVQVNGVLTHTLYVGNDNDFLGSFEGVDNPNQWYVFGFTDADLGGSAFVNQQFLSGPSAVPEPSTYGVIAGIGLLGLGFWRRRSCRRLAAK